MKSTKTYPFLKTAIAHLCFITSHTIDNGNGCIRYTIKDLFPIYQIERYV